MNQLFLGAPLLTKKIMRSFYCYRCIDEFLLHVSKQAAGIVPGGNIFKLTYDEMLNRFNINKETIPRCNITNDHYEIIYAGEESCVVAGNLNINTSVDTAVLVDFAQRITFVYVIEENELKVKHVHISTPCSEKDMESGYFPLEQGNRTYDYLQRILSEHIKTMDMMTITMKSGLKGCFNDENYSFFYVNDGLAQMLGYTREEFIEKTGDSAAGAVYAQDRQYFIDTCRTLLAEHGEYSVEYRMEKKDGSLMWVLDTGHKVEHEDDLVLINSVITDITQLKTTVFELQTDRERYRIALENVSDVMFEYDILNDVFISFEKVETEEGQRMERFEIHNFREAVESGEVIYFDDIAGLMEVYMGKRRGALDVRIKDPKDLGTELWSWKSVHCSVIYDADKRPVRTIGALRDITKEKEREEQLLHQAERDSLTGLLNQKALKIYLKQYLTGKAPDETYALFVIDLDYFKQVNDNFGHLAGNAVLMGVADKLIHVCRSTDLVARVGGDEFMVILKGIALDKAVEKADEILEGIRSIFVGDGAKFNLSCSIGIAFAADDAYDYERLFNNADQALYMAKAKGKNCNIIYQVAEDAHVE